EPAQLRARLPARDRRDPGEVRRARAARRRAALPRGRRARPRAGGEPLRVRLGRADAARLSAPPAQRSERLPPTLSSPTGGRPDGAAAGGGGKETRMSNTGTRRLGALLFPGFELLDMFGPLEMFGNMPGAVDIVTVAQHKGPVRSGQGPSALAEYGFDDCPPLDLLLIPGGMSTRTEVENEALLEW